MHWSRSLHPSWGLLVRAGPAATAPCAVHKHGAVGHSNDDMVVSSGGSAAHLASAAGSRLGQGSGRGGQAV